MPTLSINLDKEEDDFVKEYKWKNKLDNKPEAVRKLIREAIENTAIDKSVAKEIESKLMLDKEKQDEIDE